MTQNVHDLGPAGPRGNLDRNRAAASSLSVVARTLRVTTSRRSPLYQAVGLRPRFIDRVFKYLYALAFLLFLVIPNAAAIGYFGFEASDQFQAETRFTVRSSAPAVQKDRIGDLSGIPSAKIAQDTQIVANFVTSRTMLSILEEKGDFIRRYTRPDADYLARLDPASTAEERLDYWEKMVYTKIDPQSGIVTVEVRAFSAEDANAMLKIIVGASEALINDLNDRIWSDVTRSAQTQVERATAQLAKARNNLQDARNKAGILTIESTSSGISTLLVQVQGEKIALENTYRSNAETISKDAPQMRVLARQIASKTQQIEALKAQIAGQSTDSETLADTSSLFAQLQLEQTVAEHQLTASITALETLYNSSQQQLMYLEGFLAPTLPETAEYPRRSLWISLSGAGSLIAFAAALGLLSVLRNRLD